MSEVAEIIKTTYEILKNSESVPVTVENSTLGMAHAIPRGTEDIAVEHFGPWHSAEVKQVFYRETLLGAVSAEVQLILSWRYSDAKQYIIEAYLDKNIIMLDPTVDLSISVRFYQPTKIPNDPLEAFEIPFKVFIWYSPIGGSSETVMNGLIRADGTGYLNAS